MAVSRPQFDYQTGFKNKPYSQGTLFGVRPEARTPESRQPRGYSPERYTAVLDALEARRKHWGPKTYGGHEHGGHGFVVYHGHAETLARSVAAVARSTIPMSDITRPHADQPETNENPRLHLGVWAPSDARNELGHYSKPGTHAVPGQGRVAITNYPLSDVAKNYPGDDEQAKANRAIMRDELELTPIHEIGHHTDRDRPYGTPVERGRKEGYADAYAAQHAKMPGRSSLSGGRGQRRGQRPIPVPESPYAWHSERGLEDPYSRQSFDYGYQQHHRVPQHDPDPSGLGVKTYPRNHVEGQEALLHKTGSLDWGGQFKDIHLRMPDWSKTPNARVG